MPGPVCVPKKKTCYDLKAAQELVIEKERLERELQVAAGIQLSILPDVLPAAGNIAQLSKWSKAE